MKKNYVKSKFAESLELPREIVMNVPVIKITGTSEVFVENHKGIIEYTNDSLRLSTASGIIRIGGRNFCIREISQEDIIISGDIDSLEFIK
jgi:sporulation protein YqfC